MIVYTWNLKRTEYFWRKVLPDIFMDISNHKNQHHDRNIRFWFRACQNLHFDKLKNISKNQLAVHASLATIGIQRCQILTKNAKYELNTSISFILINVKSKNSHKMSKKKFFLSVSRFGAKKAKKSQKFSKNANYAIIITYLVEYYAGNCIFPSHWANDKCV